MNLESWHKRAIVMFLAILILAVLTENTKLREIIVVKYWVRDVLYAFVVYYMVALVFTALGYDKKVVITLTAFCLISALEIPQYFGVDLPIFGTGKFDLWDFVAYGLGWVAAKSIDSKLNTL